MEIEVDKNDLIESGFVPYRFTGLETKSGNKVAVTHERYMVHQSVAEALKFLDAYQKHPVLIPKMAAPVYSPKPEDRGNIINSGEIEYWEAKWGAQWFRLRTYKELTGFMQLFNYQP